MKATLLIAAFTLLSIFTFGQNLQVASYIEQTNVGPKVGTAIGFNSKTNIEFGGFYQTATEPVAVEVRRPWMVEREFYGAYLNYPVVKGRVAEVRFNVRTGVSNGENFVITPSVSGAITPIKAVKIGAGMGVRALKPTFIGRISININGRKQSNYLASND